MSFQNTSLLLLLTFGIVCGIRNSMPQGSADSGSCCLWRCPKSDEELAGVLLDSGNFLSSSKLCSKILANELSNRQAKSDTNVLAKSRFAKDMNNQAVALYLAARVNQKPQFISAATTASLKWLGLAEEQAQSVDDKQSQVASLYNRAAILSSEGQAEQSAYVFTKASKLRRQLKPELAEGLLP